MLLNLVRQAEPRLKQDGANQLLPIFEVAIHGRPADSGLERDVCDPGTGNPVAGHASGGDLEQPLAGGRAMGRVTIPCLAVPATRFFVGAVVSHR